MLIIIFVVCNSELKSVVDLIWTCIVLSAYYDIGVVKSRIRNILNS